MTDHDAYGEPVAADDRDVQPGGDLVAVPNVLGEDGLHATNLLAGMGLGVETTTIASAEPGANIVLEQNPPPDTKVFLPAVVVLGIGSGVPSQASPPPPDPNVILDS